MLKPRSLLRGDITYDAAKDSDANILYELGYRDQKIRFFPNHMILIKKHVLYILVIILAPFYRL